jgi:hypothetical protein
MAPAEFPLLNMDGHLEEDGTTVSSLGSRRTGSNQGDSFSIRPPSVEADTDKQSFAPVPPGFAQPAPGFDGVVSAQPVYDFNSTGEIRATARAFVPTVILKPNNHANSTSFPNSGAHTSLAGNSLGGFDGPINGNNYVPDQLILGNGMSGLDPMSSLLSSGAPVGNANRHLFDRPRIVTPSVTHSPGTSAASSVTGISAHDEIALPPSVGFGLDLGINTSTSSSLYDMPPISSQSIGGGFDNAATTAGLALWGSGMPPVPVSSAPNLLGGLLNFDDDVSDNQDGNGVASLPLNPGWLGGSDLNNGGTQSNGLGSIW